MKNKMSREAIKLDMGYFFEECKKYYFLQEPDRDFRACLIYICRRKEYTLDEIGELVRSVRSTIHKELLQIEKVLDSREDSELKTCLTLCKLRFSC